MRRRENDPPDQFLTLLHLEFVCSFNGYAILAQLGGSENSLGDCFHDERGLLADALSCRALVD